MIDPRLKWMFISQEHRRDYEMGFRDACKAMGVSPYRLRKANKTVLRTWKQVRDKAALDAK